jgi:hypothetical protein
MMRVMAAVYGDTHARNRPSLYATPLAWAVASFTQRLIAEAGAIVPHHTGMIVISDECSLSTIRELSRTAAGGSISPLRFAGASPSIVAGLPALQHGIRGPTLSLTMPPEHAASAVAALIDHWIRCCAVAAVIAIAHYPRGARQHLLKGLIARSAGDELRQRVSELSDPCSVA